MSLVTLLVVTVVVGIVVLVAKMLLDLLPMHQGFKNLVWTLIILIGVVYVLTHGLGISIPGISI